MNYCGSTSDLDNAIEEATKNNARLKYEYEVTNLIFEVAGMIRKLRNEKGFTQARLSRLVGFPIERLENPTADKKTSPKILLKVLKGLEPYSKKEFAKTEPAVTLAEQASKLSKIAATYSAS